jgi:hypothetical protein
MNQRQSFSNEPLDRRLQPLAGAYDQRPPHFQDEDEADAFSR